MQEPEPPIIDPRANPEYRRRVYGRLVQLRSTLESAIPLTVNRICLEIGSGHGHFLTKYASLHPARYFVGIDILGDRLRKAGRKQTVAALTNLRFVKAEASEFLGCLPGRLQIEETLVLFPDPWPKKRHHKNRLVQDGFLESLAKRMLPGGRMYFRTDHEPYLEWTRSKLAVHPEWHLVQDAPWVLEEKTVFQARAPSFGSLVAEVRTPSSARKPPD